MSETELIELAIHARERAFAPYSKFKVGAVLLARHRAFEPSQPAYRGASHSRGGCRANTGMARLCQPREPGPSRMLGK